MILAPDRRIETVWDTSPRGVRAPMFKMDGQCYPSSEHILFEKHGGAPPWWREDGPRAAWVLTSYNDAGYVFTDYDTIGLWARLGTEEHFWLCVPGLDIRACWLASWGHRCTILAGIPTRADRLDLERALHLLGVQSVFVNKISLP